VPSGNSLVKVVTNAYLGGDNEIAVHITILNSIKYFNRSVMSRRNSLKYTIYGNLNPKMYAVDKFWRSES
jgi:hypothetical protein